MTCPTCYGVPGGCATCEGTGTVAEVAGPVTFAEACARIYTEQVTGRIVVHVLHGKPKIVEIAGERVRITA